MRIPSSLAPLLFGGLLSAIMVCVVSAVVLLFNHGLTQDFLSCWFRSFTVTWPVAFPTVLVVAPMVRGVVDRLTAARRPAPVESQAERSQDGMKPTENIGRKVCCQGNEL